MQFSFEYCIDPKDHKSEEDIMENLGQSYNRLLRAGWFSPTRWRDTIWTFETLQLCLWIMPSYHLLSMEMYVKDNK